MQRQTAKEKSVHASRLDQISTKFNEIYVIRIVSMRAFSGETIIISNSPNDHDTMNISVYHMTLRSVTQCQIPFMPINTNSIRNLQSLITHSNLLQKQCNLQCW